MWAVALEQPGQGGTISALRGGCEMHARLAVDKAEGCGGGNPYDDGERALNDESCVSGLDRP